MANDDVSSSGSAPLRRSPQDKWIAGVCGGVAQHFAINANLLRLILVIATIITGGTGILVYLAGWLLIPNA